MEKIKVFFKPVAYLVCGGGVFILLLRMVLTDYSPTSFVLLLPMLVITLLITIVGIINAWVRYVTWHEAGSHYFLLMGRRELLGLYFRCFAVLAAGITLFVVSHWGLLGDALCVFLTLAALMSIVRSVNLQEVKLRQAQSENQLLKSQLNPHFLYNTLNNIDSLIWIDPERASEAIVKLSGLMRYFTYSARQNAVTLAEEVQQLQVLVDLQRLRMQVPEYLTCRIEMDQPNTSIAPLLLMPLVENCFKHCGALDQPDAIALSLLLRDGRLTFMTRNTLVKVMDDATSTPKERPHATPKHKKGVGLTVLRRRLELLYPKCHQFSAQIIDDRFVVVLEVNLHDKKL